MQQGGVELALQAAQGKLPVLRSTRTGSRRALVPMHLLPDHVLPRTEHSDPRPKEKEKKKRKKKTRKQKEKKGNKLMLW
jgi:hypothetical protein